MAKKYRVTLTADERDELERLLARGKADEAQGGPRWPDERIAEAFDAGITTVERVRRRFVEEGLASALSPYRGGKRIYERKLDGAQEAHLIALACSAPPDERAQSLSIAAEPTGRGSFVPFWRGATVKRRSWC